MSVTLLFAGAAWIVLGGWIVASGAQRPTPLSLPLLLTYCLLSCGAISLFVIVDWVCRYRSDERFSRSVLDVWTILGAQLLLSLCLWLAIGAFERLETSASVSISPIALEYASSSSIRDLARPFMEMWFTFLLLCIPSLVTITVAGLRLWIQQRRQLSRSRRIDATYRMLFNAVLVTVILFYGSIVLHATQLFPLIPMVTFGIAGLQLVLYGLTWATIGTSLIRESSRNALVS
jgi:hypothetical protein